MSSMHKTRTDDARHAAAHASNPQDRRQPRDASTVETPKRDRDASARRKSGAADDDDTLDAASRDAMTSGDPPALPGAPTLSRSRE